jgi:gas vesicle protein
MRKVCWMLSGMTFGAAAAMLAAPAPGWRTRRSIRRKAEDGYDYFEDRSRDLVEKGNELCHQTKDRVDHAVDEVSRRVKSLVG